MIRLSVLDQAPVPEGENPADAIRHSIELAKLSEQLGYYRYWVAEHHGTAAFACTAPEILIDAIASATSRLRVGSGGVLLPYYAPLKVAESFRMLEALHPGRIDLGIGRAPGAAPNFISALLGEPPTGSARLGATRRNFAEHFPRQLVELMDFLRGPLPADHPFAAILVQPAGEQMPDVWLLGSSTWSASAAAMLGLPYAFAHFIDPMATREAVTLFRDASDASPVASDGRVILAIGAVVAETESEALYHAGSIRLLHYRLRTGQTIGPLPRPDDPAIRLLPDTTRESPEWPRMVVGDAQQVKQHLTAICSALSVDELMIVTVVHDQQARRRSYELLANAFGIAPA